MKMLRRLPRRPPSANLPMPESAKLCRLPKNGLPRPSADPIVRAASVNVFMSASPSTTDSRTDAAARLTNRDWFAPKQPACWWHQVLIRQLNDSERTRVDLALKEVKQSLMVASDRAGAHMGWAMLCEQRGRAAEAIEAYETAIKVEPLTTGARTNLASLLERVASQSRGPDGQMMMQRAAQLRSEELPLLGRDASLAPDNADVQYRYGLALYLSGDQQAALKQLQKAVDLAPKVETFQTALELLREKMNE